MIRTTIKQLHDSYSTTKGSVTICGWARSIRDSKVFGFIDLNDGSSFVGVQIVFDNTLPNFEEIAHSNVGCALVVEGNVVLTPQNKQPFEVKATSIFVEGKSTPDYPLQKKRHSLEFLREIAHLRPRTNMFNAIMRVRSEASFALHSFFNSQGFVYVHSPIITASDSEGAGEMFKVTTIDINNPPRDKQGEVDFAEDFYGKPTSLTVSGQLNAECYALAFGKVYTFGPTFRAEKSNTQRHASEFWMLEPEIAFADLVDDMQLAEDMIKYVINHILKVCPEEIKFFNSFVDNTLIDRLAKLSTATFQRMTYTKAIELLKPHNDKFAYPVEWGSDIQTEHERYLTEQVCNGPVFVTDYPKDIKAFYMRLNDDNKTVAAVDMLVPGVGELIGGSQREERMDMLLARMKELNLNQEDYWWYLELRKYGGTKHAGFGLGFERLVMYLTGVSNIRDVLPFPRTAGNCLF